LKASEIRALSPKELAQQLEAAHQELFNLRFRLATKQLVNHREIPRVKRKIAQLMTIIRERELESSRQV
jgi:large subunit ribosomal protein L29